MNRFLYVMSTIFVGVFLQIFCNHYLSFFGVAPQILLLMVLANGFFCGPMMGQVLGFSCGLIIDAMGVHLFGLHSLLLALAGYTSGKMSRRIANERPTAQLAAALFATVFYQVSAYLFHGFFASGTNGGIIKYLVLSCFFNLLLVTAVFWVTERWISLWKFSQEHH